MAGTECLLSAGGREGLPAAVGVTRELVARWWCGWCTRSVPPLGGGRVAGSTWGVFSAGCPGRAAEQSPGPGGSPTHTSSRSPWTLRSEVRVPPGPGFGEGSSCAWWEEGGGH